MAQVPTQDEVNNAMLHTAQEIERKLESQALEGKGFEYNEEGIGPGVIPEDIWKEMK